MKNKDKICCIVDDEVLNLDEGIILNALNTEIKGMIKKDYKKATIDSFICNRHLLDYELQQVNRMIKSDAKQSAKINRKLTKAMSNEEYEITDVNKVMKEKLTFGQKISDSVARFGGSWTFILIFTFVLITWMLVNGLGLFGIKFDEYPYILLNLFLSCVAAIQAPIIMMSQNRSADLDRMNAENDYHVSLKTEHELRILHAKLDHLTQNQLPHDLEIEKMQLKILGELRDEINKLKK
ncbi:DUF1003 domain-containing protein [Lactobacillus sp. S2-2]|uniref:DUF1003 domain-containing protein n=1 Tax=Lactobacillus sp. S2-2 TaxID=2692917 RepID=UPI001F8E8526|nr:DUF1003 domain-containing protein [Lactobacillus sp. S2-2]